MIKTTKILSESFMRPIYWEHCRRCFHIYLHKDSTFVNQRLIHRCSPVPVFPAFNFKDSIKDVQRFHQCSFVPVFPVLNVVDQRLIRWCSTAPVLSALNDPSAHLLLHFLCSILCIQPRGPWGGRRLSPFFLCYIRYRRMLQRFFTNDFYEYGGIWPDLLCRVLWLLYLHCL